MVEKIDIGAGREISIKEENLEDFLKDLENAIDSNELADFPIGRTIYTEILRGHLSLGHNDVDTKERRIRSLEIVQVGEKTGNRYHYSREAALAIGAILWTIDQKRTREHGFDCTWQEIIDETRGFLGRDHELAGVIQNPKESTARKARLSVSAPPDRRIGIEPESFEGREGLDWSVDELKELYCRIPKGNGVDSTDLKNIPSEAFLKTAVVINNALGKCSEIKLDESDPFYILNSRYRLLLAHVIACMTLSHIGNLEELHKAALEYKPRKRI